MDAILLTGGLALSPYLPRFLLSPKTMPSNFPSSTSNDPKFQTQRPPWPVTLSAATSFLLLALSVVESIPAHWMIFLNNAERLSMAYRFIFALMVIWVLFLFPFCAGAQQQEHLWNCILQQFRSNSSITNGNDSPLTAASSHNNNKKALLVQGKRRLPLCLFQSLICMIRSSMRIVYCITYLPAKLILRRQSTRSDKGPILAMTSTDHPIKDEQGIGFHARSTTGYPRWQMLRFSTFLAGGCLGIAAVFCGLGFLGPWVVRTSQSTPLLTVAISWLTATGLMISACINGFASVSLPHSCLAGMYLQPIRPEAMAKVEGDIAKAKASLLERRKQLTGERLHVANASLNGSNKTSFTDLGEEINLRRKNLQKEIEFLETLVDEMKDELSEMKETQIMAQNARTPVGRLKQWIGLVFSVVLLVRLFFAVTFIWKHDHGGLKGNEGKSDPITIILLWLIGHDYARQQDYNTLSQLISVVLTAFLSLSQVRTFWRIVHAVDRKVHHMFCSKTPFSLGRENGTTVGKTAPHLSSNLYNYLLASLMTCYFLSCLVLTKLMLPIDYRVAFAGALGDENGFAGDRRLFRVRSYAVNSAFAFSAVVSAFVLGIVLGIQRQNSVRHLTLGGNSSTSQPSGNSFDMLEP